MMNHITLSLLRTLEPSVPTNNKYIPLTPLGTLEPSVPTVGIYKKTPIRLRRCLTLVVTVGDLVKQVTYGGQDIKKESLFFRINSLEKRRRPTLPRCNAVPSARVGLTSLFGMGRGGTPLL